MIRYEIRIPILKQATDLARIGAAILKIAKESRPGLYNERKIGLWVELREAETVPDWIMTLEEIPMPFVRKKKPDTVEVQTDGRCTWKPKPMAEILGK